MWSVACCFAEFKQKSDPTSINAPTERTRLILSCIRTCFLFLQCLVSLGVVALGVINCAGELKEIRVTAELEKQSFETVWNNPSFYSFNHRGKALFGE